MNQLILYELESAFIIVVDFKNYESSQSALKQRLSAHEIYPLYMNSYYLPEVVDTTETRFCIAVEHDYFLRFLSKLREAFGGKSKL